KPYLTIGNENLSLAAGHNTYSDIEFDDVNEAEVTEYIYHGFAEQNKSAYALWYGEQYEFKAFVVLNSGALPKELRLEESLNKPTEHPEIENGVPYNHLRRVPVGAGRVRVSRPGGVEVLSPPQDLLPLTYELPEWRERAIEEVK